MGHFGHRDNQGSLFIGCGEASGDQYASLLINALRTGGFGGEVWGMLGDQGISAGGKALWSSSNLSLMGISEVFSAIPRLVRLKNEIAAEIADRRPAAVIVIDSPDFNIPLIRTLRNRGYRGRIFYLAPPTVWAWRQGRTAQLAKYCDLCFPLFDFERQFLESRGVPCRWSGHPLVSELKGTTPPATFSDYKKKIIAMFPGSRRSEVRGLTPVLLEAARGFEERGFTPVFSIAPGLDPSVASELEAACADWMTFKGPGPELISSSEAVVGASGTAAVEALILRKFMTVIYRASWSSWAIYRLFVRTPWISVPNILAGDTLFPELLQSAVTAPNILKNFDGYFFCRGEREKVDSLMERAASMLGEGDAPAGWAESIMEMSFH